MELAAAGLGAGHARKNQVAFDQKISYTNSNTF